jgi:hypothetical protein
MAPRTGMATHVGDRLDARAAQQLDERIPRMRRMPDRPQRSHRVHRDSLPRDA